MAALYLSVDVQRFISLTTKLHLSATEVGDGTLRRDRRDLDKSVELLPKLLARDAVHTPTVKLDTGTIEELAQAVASKLGQTRNSQPQMLYSIREAIERLGIGRTTIYSMIKDGQLKPTYIGRRTLIPISETERFLIPES